MNFSGPAAACRDPAPAAKQSAGTASGQGGRRGRTTQPKRGQNPFPCSGTDERNDADRPRADPPGCFVRETVVSQPEKTTNTGLWPVT
jgi:hypothetical protein